MAISAYDCVPTTHLIAFESAVNYTAKLIHDSIPTIETAIETSDRDRIELATKDICGKIEASMSIMRSIVNGELSTLEQDDIDQLLSDPLEEAAKTPPEHALDTVDYYAARIVSKIARYSKHCGKFSLATPVVNILPISDIFLIPPNTRKPEDVEKLKKLCDRFYKNPQIELDDIQNAHIHSVYLINTDKGFAKEMDPELYLQMTKQLIEQSEIDL